MQIHVIGGVQLKADDGTTIQLQPKQQAALTVLVLAEVRRGPAHQKMVSLQQLEKLLWAPGETSNPRQRAIDMMSKIGNKLTAANLGDRLIRTSGGKSRSFRLEIRDEDYVDYTVYRKLVGNAERVPPRDVLLKSGVYGDALNLWAEPPFAGLPDTLEMERLTKPILTERLDVIEEWSKAMLGAGRHQELARDLPAIVEAHPRREKLLMYLMWALYLAQRPGEALELFTDVRERLEAEYALEPSEQLQVLCHQIRTHDPELALGSPAVPESDQLVQKAGGRPDVISPTRMSNYLVDGKYHTWHDRRATMRLLAVAPDVPALQIANERFGARAAKWAANEKGIYQFINLNALIPGPNSIHEAVQFTPRARVVNFSVEPDVINYSSELIEDVKGVRVAFAEGDLRDPATILNNPVLGELEFDFTKPVMICALDAVNYLKDEEDPVGLLKYVTDKLATGSVLVLNIATGEGMAPVIAEQIGSIYRDVEPKLQLRSYEAAVEMFDGLELVEPVAYIDDVLRNRPSQPPGRFRAFGGVAVKVED